MPTIPTAGYREARHSPALSPRARPGAAAPQESRNSPARRRLQAPPHGASPGAQWAQQLRPSPLQQPQQAATPRSAAGLWTPTSGSAGRKAGTPRLVGSYARHTMASAARAASTCPSAPSPGPPCSPLQPPAAPAAPNAPKGSCMSASEPRGREDSALLRELYQTPNVSPPRARLRSSSVPAQRRGGAAGQGRSALITAETMAAQERRSAHNAALSPAHDPLAGVRSGPLGAVPAWEEWRLYAAGGSCTALVRGGGGGARGAASPCRRNRSLPTTA
eukprot:TRINITY_DN15809_c0_g1_i1.p1 TRINITY_DN15809_c0_g1~~TRINITY_DN15809_c0_g1_i1.p1  ORF type:complete len:276 (+),score=57.18 TRINITY_DN15809_c0_g1_i1:130-957(+)